MSAGDLIFRNARLIDGTGGPSRIGDLAVTGGRIVAMDDLHDWTSGVEIDAAGLALAPGFIDSHCHAWTYWPYDPPVPDPDSRGRVEQLLNEMDLHGVDKAVIICAQIDHNPDNNDYIAEVAAQHADRLYQFPDVDCSWSETYHTPGAADRLRAIADRLPIKGFTHYLRADDDGGL